MGLETSYIPQGHKLRTYKFLLDCTLNYYHFLSLCDLWMEV